jgi:hypothetical protein
MRERLLAVAVASLAVSAAHAALVEIYSFAS